MRKIDKTTILLFITTFILTVCSIYVYSNKILTPMIHNEKIKQQYEDYVKEKNGIEIEENIEPEKILTEEQKKLELKSMTEVDRMHKYFTEYINAIDIEDYEKAYNYLYDEFKESYFKTLKEFEQYAKKAYPKFMGIQYQDIDRQGTYYILTVYIYDTLNLEITEYLEQKFVIYENDFGEFKLSFQVLDEYTEIEKQEDEETMDIQAIINEMEQQMQEQIY